MYQPSFMSSCCLAAALGGVGTLMPMSFAQGSDRGIAATRVCSGPRLPSLSSRTLRILRKSGLPIQATGLVLTLTSFGLKGLEGQNHNASLHAARSRDKHSALCLAAGRGDLAAVKRLLRVGANVNGPKGEVTPLMLAAKQSHLEILRYLLSKGARVEATAVPGSLTALLAAQDLPCIKALIQGGANVNAADVDGETVLMHWLSRPDREAEKVIRLLIANGADVHCGAEAGETSLMRAVEAGNAAVVRLLLKKGAPLEGTADNGETALSIAERKHRSDLIALLTN